MSVLYFPNFFVFYHSYVSLHFSEINGTESLFVHVPPFGVIDSSRQLDFIRTLLEVLAEVLLEPSDTSSL
jgi:hypothetical protein